MPLKATLVFSDILDGMPLDGSPREINLRFRNTGSKPWPPGVTLKSDNGSCLVKASSEPLPQTVMPGRSADICLCLDFSEAKPGHYVLWFALVSKAARLASVSVEFLLRPTSKTLRQVCRPLAQQQARLEYSVRLAVTHFRASYLSTHRYTTERRDCVDRERPRKL